MGPHGSVTYRVRYTPKVLKQIDKLDKPVVQRIRTFFEKLDNSNPRSLGRPLTGQQFWRYRIGDYRVLCHIDEGQLVVLVVATMHRRDAYRRHMS